MVLDPLGNVPIFFSALKDFEHKRQRRIVWREMLIALFAMLLFFFVGEKFTSLLAIKSSSLAITGGVILFLIGIRMVISRPRVVTEPHMLKEPLIVPLAIPGVAGPGILATISLYGGFGATHATETFLAIIFAWILTLPCVFLATTLKRIFGENALIALERLFGFIIILIAVEMSLKGLLSALHPV